MIINKKAKCASCRNGENNVPADVLFVGKARTGYDGSYRPYRAYLCKEHLIVADDNYDLLGKAYDIRNGGKCKFWIEEKQK